MFPKSLISPSEKSECEGDGEEEHDNQPFEAAVVVIRIPPGEGFNPVVPEDCDDSEDSGHCSENCLDPYASP